MEVEGSSRVSQLASIIAQNTAKYEAWCSNHGLPLPSFDVDYPVKSNLPDDISKARQAVIESTVELNALMLGPAGFLDTQMREVSLFGAKDVVFCIKFPILVNSIALS